MMEKGRGVTADRVQVEAAEKLFLPSPQAFIFLHSYAKKFEKLRAVCEEELNHRNQKEFTEGKRRE